jgi:hypothetical protein
VRTPKELAQVVTHRPFARDVGGRVFKGPSAAATKKAPEIGDEEIAIRGGAHWRHGGRMSESHSGIKTKHAGPAHDATCTVAKIAAKYPA